jgi:hypothetical protein
MLDVIGWFIVIIVVTHLVINALFMLLSPKAWFRLPKWFVPLSSSVAESRFGVGRGAIGVRLTGIVILAFIVWVVYDMFVKRT